MVYEGNEKYIFISYAHKDSPEVIPIVEALTDNGFRVWYDSGIEAGTEWPEYIEDHLIRSEVVVVFMSPAAIESRNCRNEINFALELKKEVLVIYLHETELVKGMRLQLNSTQSLFKENHSSEESFIEHLLDAKIIAGCRGTNTLKFYNDNKKVISPKNEARRTLIKNVCSVGTNDEKDMWPDGEYSPILNRDEFSFVFFHMFLSETLGFSGKVVVSSKIYNSNDNLVFDTDFDIDVIPQNDRFTFGWILKGADGSFVPSGDYRLVCSVNNSPEYTYNFTVTSDSGNTGNSLKSRSSSGFTYVCTIESILFSSPGFGISIRSHIKKGALRTGDSVTINGKSFSVAVDKVFSLSGLFSNEIPVEILLVSAQAEDIRIGDTIFKNI